MIHKYLLASRANSKVKRNRRRQRMEEADERRGMPERIEKMSRLSKSPLGSVTLDTKCQRENDNIPLYNTNTSPPSSFRSNPGQL